MLDYFFFSFGRDVYILHDSWLSDPLFSFSSVLIVLICGSVKKDSKGVDILASLCNKYETSEDELRKTMEKANNLIADIFYKKPQPASECRIGNLENIDTGTFIYIYI